MARREPPEAKAGPPMVRWNKPYFSDARIISVADWKRAGVDAETPGLKSVAWNAANNWAVLVSDLDFLTEDQFQMFIVADQGFKVEDPE